jgi:hypothetical protein
MKKYLILLVLTISFSNTNAQTCEEIMEYVKANGSSTSYVSYDSEAISKVTFYTVSVDFKTLYFAIVCFKKQYSYSCTEYIYQVGSNTQFNYSLDHYNSAGKAFWKHIEPYNENLECAPDFD